MESDDSGSLGVCVIVIASVVIVRCLSFGAAGVSPVVSELGQGITMVCFLDS